MRYNLVLTLMALLFLFSLANFVQAQSHELVKLRNYNETHYFGVQGNGKTFKHVQMDKYTGVQPFRDEDRVSYYIALTATGRGVRMASGGRIVFDELWVHDSHGAEGRVQAKFLSRDPIGERRRFNDRLEKMFRERPLQISLKSISRFFNEDGQVFFDEVNIEVESSIESAGYARNMRSETVPPRGSGKLVHHATYLLKGAFAKSRGQEGSNVIGFMIDKRTGLVDDKFLRDRTGQDDGISFQIRARSQKGAPGSSTHYDAMYGFLFSWEQWKTGSPSSVQDFILVSDPKHDGKTAQTGFFHGAKAKYAKEGEEFRFNKNGYEIILRILKVSIHEIQYRGDVIPVFEEFKLDIAVYAINLRNETAQGGHVDFSAQSPRENGLHLVSTLGFVFNTSQRNSWRAVERDARLEFHVAGYSGNDTKLTITHLSSGGANAKGGGYSPIAIFINGKELAREFDPAEHHGGVHHFVSDSWPIGKYLQSGDNEIVLLVSPRAQTHYWIQKIEIAGLNEINKRPPAVDSRILQSIIRETPALVIRKDTDIQNARRNTLVDPDKRWTEGDLDFHMREFERYQYYMGRLEVKVRILANQAGKDREANDRMQAVEQYMRNADQHVTLPPLDQTMANMTIAIDPKDQFARDLYNAYLKEQDSLNRGGIFLLQNTLTHLTIMRGNATKVSEDLYRRGVEARNRGIHDAGGISDVDYQARQFGLKVLIPVFEGAKTSQPSESPIKAAEAVIRFFGEISKANQPR